MFNLANIAKSLTQTMDEPDEKKVRVLIVEDDPNLSRLWVDVLSSTALVEQVYTEMDAIRVISSNSKPDIMILDWNLSGKSADMVLTTWTREIGGPCAVITGAMEIEERYTLYPKGVWNTFRKPLSIDVILSIVRNYQQIIVLKQERAFYISQLKSMRQTMVIILILMSLIMLSGNADIVIKLLGL